MDPAVCTLLGALGGVLLTQVANYMLENKRANNHLIARQLELDSQRHYDLLKERRSTYSAFLASIDKYMGGEKETITDVADCLYTALIVASADTTDKINATVTIVKHGKPLAEYYLKSKRGLFEAMHADLQN